MAGYIGNAPVPQATQTRDNFTATAGQTSFATSGYTPGYLDVYLNGVRLDESDYTATNGSDVVLDTGAAVDDVVTVVAFQTFEVAGDEFTLTDITAKDSNGIQFNTDEGTERARIDDSGNLLVGTSSTAALDGVKGVVVANSGSVGYAIDDSTGGGSYLTYTTSGNYDIWDSTANATRMRIDSSGNLLVGTTESNPTSSSVNVAGQAFSATGGVRSTVDANPAATFNRKTSDGPIALFRKDGTTVGSIGSEASGLLIGSGNVGVRFIDSGQDRVIPRKTTLANADAAIDLGDSGSRFKDLYLSGGVYLGGTGSANHLDDYEEGTWTCSIGGYGASTTSRTAYYTKVGRLVTLHVEYQTFATSAGSGSTDVTIEGVPFNITEGATGKVGLKVGAGSNQGISLYSGGGASANKFLLYADSGTAWNRLQGSEFTSLALGFTIQYIT